MKENLSPKKPRLNKVAVQKWLNLATEQLNQQGISTARLDCLILIADELQKDKSWIIAHPEYQLDCKQQENLNKKLNRRKNYEPIAYIRGFQEFYRRKFIVSPATLIPRPESEDVIDQLKELPHRQKDKLVDIGTGSGILAITSKLEIPSLEVYATDISQSALNIAKQNAINLSANIKINQQNLLENDQQQYRFILANLPYVSSDWKCSPETNYEPSTALFAPDNGQSVIKKLISQSSKNLTKNGYIILEADPRQHRSIIDYAKNFNLDLIKVQNYIITLGRIGF